MGVPTIYRSTDTSAPALNGNAGSLIAVLDGCLVTGYGTKTALGWGKAFTGTNRAVYQAAAGVRHYLDVDDTGPDATALGRNARLRGYEVATGVGAGTGPFPTVAQVATVVQPKSNTADATVRPWLLIGDDRTFILLNTCSGTNPPTLATNAWGTFMMFGEFVSALSGDNYRTVLAYATQSSAITTDQAAALTTLGTIASNTSASFQVSPRAYFATGTAIWNTFLGQAIYLGGSTSGSLAHTTAFAFPNPVDGGIYINAVLLVERGSAASPIAPNAGNGIRGRARGLYESNMTLTNFNDQDTFSGVGDFAGKTFMVAKISGTTSGVVLETTDWAAST